MQCLFYCHAFLSMTLEYLMSESQISTVCLYFRPEISTLGGFAPKGCWTVSGDICGCHNWGWGTTGIQQVEARDAAKYPTRDSPKAKNDLVHYPVNRAQGRETLLWTQKQNETWPSLFILSITIC